MSDSLIALMRKEAVSSPDGIKFLALEDIEEIIRAHEAEQAQDVVERVAEELKQQFGGCVSMPTEMWENKARKIIAAMGESGDSGDTHRGTFDSSTPTQTLNDCPICESKKFKPSISQRDNERWYTTCFYCGARAGGTKNREDAIKIWNGSRSEISGNDKYAALFARVVQSALDHKVAMPRHDFTPAEWDSWQYRKQEILNNLWDSITGGVVIHYSVLSEMRLAAKEVAYKKEIDALPKREYIKGSAIGVACMKHDLTHYIKCGHCYDRMQEALKAISNEGWYAHSNNAAQLVEILDEHKRTADAALGITEIEGRKP